MFSSSKFFSSRSSAPVITIISHPVDQVIDNGIAEFSVTASINPSSLMSSLTYQWQKSDDGLNWTNVQGASQSFASTTSSSVLSLSNLTEADNDTYYRVIISSGTSSVTSKTAYLSYDDIGPIVTQGNNSSGQLGRPTSFNNNLVFQGLQGGNVNWNNVKFRKVSAGNNFSLAIRSDGTLWSWGGNSVGQLGTGEPTGSAAQRNYPAQIGTNTWRSVSAGAGHALAIKSDGSLWSWGLNDSGQLGNGVAQGQQSSPILISSQSWKMVSAGNEHSLAIRSDGTLWAWGNNQNGELGDGTPIDRPSMRQVAGQWKSISAGFNHSLAIKSDGTIWGFGSNTYGQLGENSRIATYSPVQVLTGNWKEVAAGQWFSVGLKTDGTIWFWGDNSIWIGGDGSSSGVPFSLGVGFQWRSISVKSSTITAIRSDYRLHLKGRVLGTVLDQNNNPIQTEITYPNLTLIENQPVYSCSASGHILAIRAQ